ncbi:IMP-specific 5'-nucleotidase 1 [Cytospora mali]|uniref:IMP-specific 5'-nucleotidase 1 n=1 Tax=Cytospora mali TaxID=578113 RepID=A0A194UZG4_CYTMA|nr:IMP-specific 5'-nucleotidase 1 [Valsa mali var. pyri (nom. inval.)]
MTTRYRVEYALKTHRRDQFIEWIKGLLAVPFVLHSQPHGVFQSRGTTLSLEHMSEEAARRYAEIMRDVEVMIDDHIILQNEDSPLPSKLKLLVPTVGPFFTRLPLEAAFKYQDRKRYISRRRFVSPSFNDVRLILNSAQSMAVTTYSTLQLATFDGDVTLYDDGQSLEPSSPLVPRLLDLLRKNVRIGIVTAAGYTTADRYYERLHGLLDALAAAPDVSPSQKGNLLVMGGEANYLFAFDAGAGPHLLRHVPRGEWLTPEMEAWSEGDIAALLDDAEAALRECIKGMNLPATLMRKDRAVGIIPDPPNVRIPRESLEETVLVTQKILEFNGGRDVFVDIGDKSWGVTVCQKYFEKQSRASGHGHGHGHGHGQSFEIGPENTLHVGDQFLSAGANDFRARSVGTTAWIASPEETVELLDELADLMGKKII